MTAGSVSSRSRAVSDDILLVPTRGHTRGHVAVAVRRPSGGWFLHAGDAYFSAGEKQTPPTCPTGLSVFQTLVQIDKKARHANQDRLRSFHAEHGPGRDRRAGHDVLRARRGRVRRAGAT